MCLRIWPRNSPDNVAHHHEGCSVGQLGMRHKNDKRNDQYDVPDPWREYIPLRRWAKTFREEKVQRDAKRSVSGAVIQIKF